MCVKERGKEKGGGSELYMLKHTHIDVQKVTGKLGQRGKQEDGVATTGPKAEKRIPLAWNETREISAGQEPECD